MHRTPVTVRFLSGSALAVALTAGLVTPAAATAATVPAAVPATVPTAGSARTGGDDGLVVRPVLKKRATLSADYSAPGPDSGALATPANGRTGPFHGQVVPGFSGLLPTSDHSFWAMPDNGFGTKANSADFLLRLYLVKPRWETEDGGPGDIEVKRFVSLRDPDHRIGFPIVNESTPDRLLTGADLDIESLARGSHGSFWIGDEFGPFLLHVAADGRLLQAPVPFPGGKSPDNPTLGGQTPNVARSRGFEAMAESPDGRRLYPIVEGRLADDADPRRRRIYEFDIARNRYTGRTWAYQTDTDANLVGDAHWRGDHQLVVVERDDLDGPAAVTKRLYSVDLAHHDAEGFARKELLVDLLKIENAEEIGVHASPGAYGVGKDFSFPFQSVETVVPLSEDRFLLANDNNYPGNDARYPGRPDDTEMVVIGLRKHHLTKAEAGLIAHRGASGYRPEHTLASYELAIQQGADYIEPDLVTTKDGVLVDRHEPEISTTTDVAAHPEFASRRTTKIVDGLSYTGWFTEDFTLAELRTLRAKERLPLVRPQNTVFDGLYQIPTFDEVVDLARHSFTTRGRQVGVYPETKHPTYFRAMGKPLESTMLSVLASDDYDHRDSPVGIQSFETGNLRSLARRTPLRLVQLVDCVGAPYDLVSRGDPRTYADLVQPAELRKIKRYADEIALCKDVMIPLDDDGRLLKPTPVIDDAHDAGLAVTGWTFRRENQFLPLQFRVGTDPNGVGDLEGEITTFLAAGMDSFFTDNPDIGDEARTDFRPDPALRSTRLAADPGR